MYQKFFSCITGSPQGSDHRSLFDNRIVCCHRKNKGHDCNQDIQKHDHHRTVTAHIVSGEMDRLICIAWDIACHRCVICQYLKKVIGTFFLCFFSLWRIIICPGITIFKVRFFQIVKGFICNNGNTELNCIKHHIRIIGKQCTVIRQCHIACHRFFFFSDFYDVTNLYLVILCIHTIDGNLIFLLGKLSFHQAYEIDLAAVFVNADCTVLFPVEISICIFFDIVIFINLNAFFFQSFDLTVRCLFLQCKVSIFDVIFLKAFLISCQHTVICHQETRDKSDRRCHKKKNCKVFSNVTDQFSWKTFEQWIFHILTALPFQISCCDLGFIDIIFPDLSVPELYDTVCHIFDGIIVRYHDHRVAVFLVDLLDQAEDFFGSLVIQCTRRLITQKNVRIFDDCTPDCRPLLLSAGKLVRQLVAMFIQPKCFQKLIQFQRSVA